MHAKATWECLERCLMSGSLTIGCPIQPFYLYFFTAAEDASYLCLSAGNALKGANKGWEFHRLPFVTSKLAKSKSRDVGVQ